ncbi:MAG: ABC transporter permease [Acidobacteriota bacterium]
MSAFTDRRFYQRASLVARRELLENLRTKAFWLSVLSFPVILVLATLVPVGLDQARQERLFSVVDESGWWLETVGAELDEPGRYRRISPEELTATEPTAAELRAEQPSSSDQLSTLNDAVARGELFAYLVIPANPESEGLRYVAAHLTDNALVERARQLTERQLRYRHLAAAGLDEDTIRAAEVSVEVDSRAVDASGTERVASLGEVARQWAPVAFVYLLWIAIFAVAQMLLTNTIEEKSQRILEVLLSSVTPIELLAGKILGIAATGLTLVSSWGLFFFGIIALIGLLVPLPDDLDLQAVVTDPLYLGSFAVYFVLGYLLYAALLVGIGAVCDSLKEAQNLLTPVYIVLMVPLFAMIPIAEDPNGPLARALSFVPPFTPFVMMNRAAGPPAPWEYAVTAALLIATIALTLWAAAKIFRVGILMTGSRPSLRDLIRWLRAPVGPVVETDEESAPAR